jgi:hypothetical protein
MDGAPPGLFIQLAACKSNTIDQEINVGRYNFLCDTRDQLIISVSE